MREQRRGGARFRSLLEFIRRRSFSRHYRGKPQIRKAREETEHVQQDAEEEAAGFRALEDEFDDPGKPQRKYVIKNPERVLVRLKVEHTGFTTLNNQRFGSQFVGQVVSSRARDLRIILFTEEYNLQRHVNRLPPLSPYVPHRPCRPILPTFYSSTSVARPRPPREARPVPRGKNAAQQDWTCRSSRRIWSR